MIRINNIQCGLSEKLTKGKIAKHIGIAPERVKSWTLLKKAVDARKKTDVHYCISVDAEIEGEIPQNKNVQPIAESPYLFPKKKTLSDRPVVIGSGPAGLFAAYMLAENGYRPILLERGCDIVTRKKRVEDFWKNGVFSPVSNVQFGEGGAGTFSDGKLTTGIHDPRCRKVLEIFVRHGAPEEILYRAKPHIGTDRLFVTVQNMRKEIEKNGGEVRFEALAEDFLIENGAIRGVVVNGEELFSGHVILAIGHSARDTIRTLFRLGVPMIPKAFSVGARIEHPQELINQSQYGAAAEYLGAADYKLSCKTKTGRGVYTFCMCPGGFVVASASEEGGVVTNGMSYFARDGKNANAALLVDVKPSDFSGDDPLAGICFQEEIEKRAYLCGGKSYAAPVQLVGDFLKNRPTQSLGAVRPTYRPGTVCGDIRKVLPEFVTDAMQEALPILDRKLHGFSMPDAVLTVPETRSSSPVRILRDPESLQSAVSGLYPCGEGAGYAGGIMSAAVDGIRCAEQIAKRS